MKSEKEDAAVQKENNEELGKTKNSNPTEEIKPGDHIYIWKCLYTYQRHAIVLSVSDDEIMVVEFYQDNALIQITSLENFAPRNRISKVKYSASYSTRIFSRAGTVTPQDRDPQQLIIARLQHIILNPHILPEFNPLSSNDECICVWIATGIYCTLQVCSQLYFFSAGQVKSAVVTAGAAAHASVTVPMTGMWGMLGYTTSVPLLTAQPLILPLLVGYGLISFVPLAMLQGYKHKWKKMQHELNRGFWESASEEILEKFWILKNWSIAGEFFDGDSNYVDLEESDEKRKDESNEVIP